jgi:transposase
MEERPDRETSVPEDPEAYPSGLITKDGVPAFSEADWQMTPKAVRLFVLRLAALGVELEKLREEVERLRAMMRSDSSNSDKPPSSDSPYKRKAKGKGWKKRGAKKGHRGYRQQMLEPTKSEAVLPVQCPCGGREFTELKPYHTHQVIELPEIQMEVTHFVLHEGRCVECGRLQKAELPAGTHSGYGPRLTAFAAELGGIQGNSRATVRDLFRSVLRIPISNGAIQKMIYRVSEAIRPHYEAIGRQARCAPVNHVDETSWFKQGALQWLWVMANATVAFFLVHPHRSKEAFLELIDDWVGILVSDGYGLYRQWVELRQSCLAHLIRKAKGLAESADPHIARFGRKMAGELGRLCQMAHAPPTVGYWRAWYARFTHLVSEHQGRKDAAGSFARRLLGEMESLWVFIEIEGVEPTNNRAERALRYGVLWRKRSQGTQSDRGNRWVERILSLRQTCRLRGKPTYPVLVEATEAYFRGHSPDLAWIAQH